MHGKTLTDPGEWKEPAKREMLSRITTTGGRPQIPQIGNSTKGGIDSIAYVITKTDIDNGVCGHPTQCAHGRAITRAIAAGRLAVEGVSGLHVANVCKAGAQDERVMVVLSGSRDADGRTVNITGVSGQPIATMIAFANDEPGVKRSVRTSVSHGREIVLTGIGWRVSRAGEPYDAATHVTAAVNQIASVAVRQAQPGEEDRALEKAAEILAAGTSRWLDFLTGEEKENLLPLIEERITRRLAAKRERQERDAAAGPETPQQQRPGRQRRPYRKSGRYAARW